MALLVMEQLKAFVVLQQEGNVTRAAEALGRTQPAISQQLKKLEEQVEQQLFNREGNRLVLTAAGNALLVYAQEMLKLNDDVFTHFSNIEISGRIHLGIPSEFATTLMPKIIGRFAKAYPEVTLEVSCDLSRNLLAADPQRYDLVLALHDKTPKKLPGLIKIDPLVWVGAIRVNEGLLDEEAPVPLIAAPDGCIYRKRALSKLNEVKRECRLVYTIPDLQGISAAIDEGLGITVLAKSTVPSHLKVLNDKRLPPLGDMGISIKRGANANRAAVDLLAESIAEGLR